MRYSGGPTMLAKSTVKSKSDAFLVFFKEIIPTIVKFTNQKAETDGSTFRTNEKMVQKFLCACMLIGLYKGRGEPPRTLWNVDEGRPILRKIISRNNFELHTTFLRFDNSNTRQSRQRSNKFAPMGVVWETWQSKLKNYYIPHAYVAIDEQLIGFRGNCPFRQYMPSKPAKYGIKYWALCDTSGYCLKIEPYLGASEERPASMGVGEHVIDTLSRGMDEGRTIVCDNFFTSLAVGKILKQRKLALVGTVRKNRRELPPEFTKLPREPNSCIYGFRSEATLLSFAPKKRKVVVLLSTQHSDGSLDPNGKPEIINTYNKYMGAVDKNDFMTAAVTARRRTRRWPMAVFYHMINISCLNSYVLWKGLHPEKLSRRDFIKDMTMEILGVGEARPPETASPPKNKKKWCVSCRKHQTRKACNKCKKCVCDRCVLFVCKTCDNSEE